MGKGVLMSRLDRLKFELEIHKQIFFVAWAVVIAITGWAITNADRLNEWLLGAVILGLFGAILIAEYNRRQMKKLLVEIERC